MLIPPKKYRDAGWKITTVGDDIVWMWVDETGKLRAINPEAGYFGVVPGTNEQTNPNAMAACRSDTIFTNVALLPDGDVWWEGKTAASARTSASTGRASPGRPIAAARRRIPTAASPRRWPTIPRSIRRPTIPAGVPVSAIIFGGRRSHAVPLVFQAFNWMHGVYLGATLGSETTAAASGQVGVVRRDPMAMLPFIGYNIRDYLVHWFRMRKKMTDCPRIFHVNWFRHDDAGQIPLAGLRREHARPEMDHRPLAAAGPTRGKR